MIDPIIYVRGLESAGALVMPDQKFNLRRATQGGIQPSRTTDNVLLFSDPQAGALHGYNFDGFASDGAYYYTGEGQVGDQEIVRGNAAIVNHREQNRALQLFEAAGGRQPGGKPQRFIGTFELDPAEPYASGVPRRVVVFRLIPTTAVAATADHRIKTLDLRYVSCSPAYCTR